MRVRHLLIGMAATAVVTSGVTFAGVPAAVGVPTYTITINASRVGAGVLVTGVISDSSSRGALTPMVKLPGAATYTAGVARPSPICGDFTWNRHIRAGRTISVYFTDGVVESNVVRITPTTVGVGVRSRDRLPRC
jgi:hypothetical protein